MISYTANVTIDRPPEDVFDALLDAELYEQWTPMTDGRWVGSGSPTVGTTGSFTMPKGPIKGTLRTVITELDRPRRLAMAMNHPTLDWKATFALQPTGGGTRLTAAGDIRLRGWRRLLEPLMAGEVRSGEQKEVERLKALLERGRRPGGATSSTRALQP